MSLETATRIAKLVAGMGGRALVVGGWVRDQLLGRPSKDVDVEVYGVPASRLQDLLETIGPVDTVGESFTVFKVDDVDVSLPRIESKTGRGHRAFAVTGDPNLSPEEAARRRDFTINASRRSADRRAPRPVRRPDRPPAATCFAPSIPPPSATTAFVCCAQSSSPRASS
jgi:tRNA nucleotidyltransferase/poly(A) polymerase